TGSGRRSRWTTRSRSRLWKIKSRSGVYVSTVSPLACAACGLAGRANLLAASRSPLSRKRHRQTPSRLFGQILVDLPECLVAAGERLQQDRVDLPGRVLQDDLYRLVVLQGGLVQPLPPQRVVDVGQAGQPGRRRDGVAGQPVGVAVAVV